MELVRSIANRIPGFHRKERKTKQQLEADIAKAQNLAGLLNSSHWKIPSEVLGALRQKRVVICETPNQTTENLQQASHQLAVLREIDEEFAKILQLGQQAGEEIIRLQSKETK